MVNNWYSWLGMVTMDRGINISVVVVFMMAGRTRENRHPKISTGKIQKVGFKPLSLTCDLISIVTSITPAEPNGVPGTSPQPRQYQHGPAVHSEPGDHDGTQRP